MSTDIWTYSNSNWEREDLTGFEVEALDGGIGKVDETTDEVGASSIVVDTGPWIFGKKVVLPAGTIDRIDPDEERVYVNRTKDQIKDAPQLDKEMRMDARHRDDVAGYYGPAGPPGRIDARKLSSAGRPRGSPRRRGRSTRRPRRGAGRPSACPRRAAARP